MKGNVAMFLAILALSVVGVAGTENTANPIRRVVSLLQNMAKKVSEEAEAETKLYDKYMCWCSTSGGELTASIAANEAKVEQLASDIEAGVALKATLESELKGHKESRAA